MHRRIFRGAQEMDAVDELDCVRKAVGGDRAALERLLLAHYDALARHVAGALPAALQSVVGVDDILQQTFVDAFRGVGDFQPRDDKPFVAWLKVIANHRLTDAIKAHGRKKRGGGRQATRTPRDGQHSSYVDLLEMLSTDRRSPSQSVAAHEAIQAVQIAVAGLPLEQREAIRLRYLEGKSLDETASAMQRTQNAIRGLLHRAKQSLKEMLGNSSQWYSKK